MARKRQDENQIPDPIDYLSLIDEYGADAFSLCRSKLFPYFNYALLTENDVRPIDLKDQIVQLLRDIYGIDQIADANITGIMADILQAYLLDFAFVASDSRAEKYKNRAIQLTETILSGQCTVKDLEDVLLIMIALLKPNKDNIGAKTAKLIQDPDFTLDRDDIEILEELLDIMLSQFERRGFLESKAKNTGAKNSILFVHVINIVLFCHILHQRGAFLPEDAV